MANGIEDLKEKNKESKKKNITNAQYKKWSSFDGREDAEMLYEKKIGWSAVNSSRGEYDDED